MTSSDVESISDASSERLSTASLTSDCSTMENANDDKEITENENEEIRIENRNKTEMITEDLGYQASNELQDELSNLSDTQETHTEERETSVSEESCSEEIEQNEVRDDEDTQKMEIEKVEVEVEVEIHREREEKEKEEKEKEDVNKSNKKSKQQVTSLEPIREAFPSAGLFTDNRHNGWPPTRDFVHPNSHQWCTSKDALHPSFRVNIRRKRVFPHPVFYGPLRALIRGTVKEDLGENTDQKSIIEIVRKCRELEAENGLMHYLLNKQRSIQNKPIEGDKEETIPPWRK